MPEKTGKLSKKERRELAAKRAKRKKTITLVIVLVAALALAAVVIAYQIQQSKVETYSDGRQTVRLLPNGTFSASLFHGERYEGTFSKSPAGDVVVFTVGGVPAEGSIENETLTFPEEWQDGHGHGSTLPRQ